MTRKMHTILLIGLILGFILVSGCDTSKTKHVSGSSPERIVLGTSKIYQSSLIWVAKDRGYFTEQGLDVELKIYGSGNLALQDLVHGRLDLATATEFATVLESFKHPDIRIISVLDEEQDQELVARKDSGIAKLSDLKAKRIGLARNTNAEYYLELLLLLENMKPEDVQIVDLLPGDQVKALSQGDIDAVVLWNPYSTMVKLELGPNGVSWSSQSGQDSYWLLLGTRETIEKKSDIIRRFVAALASAETCINNDSDLARKIAAKELEHSILESSWKNHKFALGLHRPLALKMDAEVSWLQYASGGPEPNFRDVYELIYFDALRSVEKEKVEIDR